MDGKRREREKDEKERRRCRGAGVGGIETAEQQGSWGGGGDIERRGYRGKQRLKVQTTWTLMLCKKYYTVVILYLKNIIILIQCAIL